MDGCRVIRQSCNPLMKTASFVSLRSAGLLCLLYVASLNLMVVFRLLSQRDQPALAAMYAAINQQAVLHAFYIGAQIAGALLLGIVARALVRQCGAPAGLLGTTGTFLFTASSGCWLVGAIMASVEHRIATELATLPSELLGLQAWEMGRQFAGRLAFSLAGAGVLSLGPLLQRSLGTGRWFLALTALSGLAPWETWWSIALLHRVGGSTYALWFLVLGLLLVFRTRRYARAVAPATAAGAA